MIAGRSYPLQCISLKEKSNTNVELSMMSSDEAIRNRLKNFLNNRTPKPNAIIEELRIHNGNAIADIVAVYRDAHCFEIKGESDKLSRVMRQSEFYNTTRAEGRGPSALYFLSACQLKRVKKVIPDFEMVSMVLFLRSIAD